MIVIVRCSQKNEWLSRFGIKLYQFNAFDSYNATPAEQVIVLL